jgi:N-acetylmuramoyl-L-alanine amidase
MTPRVLPPRNPQTSRGCPLSASMLRAASLLRPWAVARSQLRLLSGGLCLLLASTAGAQPEPSEEPASAAPAYDHVTLADFAARYGLEVSVADSPGKRVGLLGTGVELSLEPGSREARFNGFRLFLAEPLLMVDGQLRLAAIDEEALLRPLLRPASLGPAGPLRVIALDPGHGGRDPGARSVEPPQDEKAIALDVALRLAEVLRARGFQVVLTRDQDRFIPLPERAEIANRAGADLFISIHLNAASNPAVRGIETYVLTPAGFRSTSSSERSVGDASASPGNRQDGWNTLWGFLVQRSLAKGMEAPDRGLKRARFQVLKGLAAPGALLELGYLSNAEDARLLADPAYRDRLAATIADAVDAFAGAVTRIRLDDPQPYSEPPAQSDPGLSDLTGTFSQAAAYFEGPLDEDQTPSTFRRVTLAAPTIVAPSAGRGEPR